MPPRPPSPVLHPRIDPKICQCDMQAGDVFVVSYYGKPFSLHVACPVCGFRDLVLLVTGDAQDFSWTDGAISRLLPGWRCASPHCRVLVKIIGGRFSTVKQP